MRRRGIWALATLLTSGLSQTGAETGPGIHWQLRGVDATRMNLNGVASWSDGFSTNFLAVSINGQIRDSPDGSTWTTRWSKSSVGFEALATDGTVAVASGIDVNNSYIPAVLRAPDGITWTYATTPPSPANRIRDIVWTGTRFVAACDGGHIFTSSDGDVWGGHHQLSATRDIHALHWTGYRLLAVGQIGFIASTTENAPDALADWTIHDPGKLPRSFADMARADVGGTERLILVGGFGTVMSSDDEGNNRTPRTSGTTSYLKAVVATSIPTRTFLAVGSGGKVLSSPDGITWNSETSGTSATLESVTWSIPLNLMEDPTAIIVGADDTILTSENGADWTPRVSGTEEILHGVCSGWFVGPKPNYLLARRIVAVGSEGTILISSSGTTWTPQVSVTTRVLRAVAALDFGFVAVGDHGTILTSANGVTWTPRSTGDTTNLNAVHWTGSQLVAVGQSGVIYTSPDGSAWTRRHALSPETLLTVISLPSGRLCAAGYHETFLTSDPLEDFADWIDDEPTPPGQDDPQDDPNGDGFDNLTAYAHYIGATGTPDPALLALLPRMIEPAPDGRMRLQCIAPIRDDLEYIIEQSDTLEPATWAELFRYSRHQIPPPGTLGLGVRLGSGFLTIDLPENPATHPHQFNRLRIEQIPP